jgi:hypothetical protein
MRTKNGIVGIRRTEKSAIIVGIIFSRNFMKLLKEKLMCFINELEANLSAAAFANAMPSCERTLA